MVTAIIMNMTKAIIIKMNGKHCFSKKIPAEYSWNFFMPGNCFGVYKKRLEGGSGSRMMRENSKFL